MSSWFNVLRKRHDPRGYIKRLAEEFAAYRAIQEQPDSEQFKDQLRTKEYLLLCRESKVVGQIPLIKTENALTFEPDGQFVTIMHNFNLALQDQSGFNNHAFAQFTFNQQRWGDTKPDNPDPFSFALEFNRLGTINKYDKLYILPHDTIQVVFDTAVGFSIFVRFKPDQIAPDGTSPVRWLFYKEDDLDNAAQVVIGSDGRLYFEVKKGGTGFQCRSTSAVISAPVWFDCWFIWNNATNTPTMWVNNVQNSETGTFLNIGWAGQWNDLIIGAFAFGNQLGQFSGVIDCFYMYRNYLVNGTEISRMWQNQCTIAPITISDVVGISIIDRSRIAKGTGVGPDMHDYTGQDYVDADYWETPPPVTIQQHRTITENVTISDSVAIVKTVGGGGGTLADFVDADFIDEDFV